MSNPEPLTYELHRFAEEVHALGYSSWVTDGAEREFVELATRMHQRADLEARARERNRLPLAVEMSPPPAIATGNRSATARRS